jgi:hypothetical protein
MENKRKTEVKCIQRKSAMNVILKSLDEINSRLDISD